MDARDIIISPVITEKSTDLITNENKYTFRVDLRANKTQIKHAIEEIFNVTVLKVNTSRVRGKIRRQGQTQGRRSDWKKAVVSLKEGQTIEVFEAL